MQFPSDALAAATVSLEQALVEDARHGRRVWAARVDQALAAVEEAAYRQDRDLEFADGSIWDVSGGQSPSPGMDRRVHRLHDDVDGLLVWTARLRSRVRRLLEDDTATPTVEELRDRGLELLQALGKHERREARLILENATTDIGAGD